MIALMKSYVASMLICVSRGLFIWSFQSLHVWDNWWKARHPPINSSMHQNLANVACDPAFKGNARGLVLQLLCTREQEWIKVSMMLYLRHFKCVRISQLFFSRDTQNERPSEGKQFYADEGTMDWSIWWPHLPKTYPDTVLKQNLFIPEFLNDWNHPLKGWDFSKFNSFWS